MNADRTKIGWVIILILAAAALIAVFAAALPTGDGRNQAEPAVGNASAIREEAAGPASKDGASWAIEDRPKDQAGALEVGKTGPQDQADEAAPGTPVEYDITSVEWEHESRAFTSADELFFSDPGAHFVFNIRTPSSKAMTDLGRWYPQIEAYALVDGEREPVQFFRSFRDFEGFGQIRIQFKNAPERDIHIAIHGAEGFASIRHVLHYTEPFRYEMKSDDPVYTLLMRAHEWEPSFWGNWWAFTGEKIRLEIAFTKEVDRLSAEAKFREIFGEHAWSAAWRSPREAELALELFADKRPYPVLFDLSGITDQDGYKLVDFRPISIYPHAGFRYGVLDPVTLETKERFRFSQPFYAFLPNDDGTLALAQISRQDETGPSLYVLLDLKQGGSVVDVYKPGRMQDPQWVSGSSSFLYASKKDGANIIEIRNALTGEGETFWTSPYHDGNHDGLRWARAYAVPGDKRLYVMDYRATSPGYGFSFTADLYIWDDIGDDSPDVIRDFQQGRCEGAPCFGAFKVVSDGVIYYDLPIEDAEGAPYSRHMIYHPIGHAQSELKLSSAFDPARLTLYPLDQNRVLLVQETRSEQKWTYSFFIYDPRQKRHEHLFDAEEWSGSSSFGQSVPLGNDLFLVGTGEKGVLLDLANRELTPVNYEPAAQAGKSVYWVERIK